MGKLPSLRTIIVLVTGTHLNDHYPCFAYSLMNLEFIIIIYFYWGGGGVQGRGVGCVPGVGGGGGGFFHLIIFGIRHNVPLYKVSKSGRSFTLIHLMRVILTS